MAKQKRNPGQRTHETRPRGNEFEKPAAPEATNRDHPEPAGRVTTTPGMGVSSGEHAEMVTEIPRHRQRAGAEGSGGAGYGDIPPIGPEVSSGTGSAGEAALDTTDPNYSPAHALRGAHQDAGVSRMDTSGRREEPIATHSRDPQLVRDVMTADVEVCNPNTELYYVARMMMERDCGAIPVVESTDSMRPVGVVTDRDIVTRCIARNDNPLSQRARDCMSSELITVSPDAPLKECVRLMEKHQIRRILVIDNTGRLCGVVAQADLVASADEHMAAELVKEVSEPTHNEAPPT